MTQQMHAPLCIPPQHCMPMLHTVSDRYQNSNITDELHLMCTLNLFHLYLPTPNIAMPANSNPLCASSDKYAELQSPLLQA